MKKMLLTFGLTIIALGLIAQKQAVTEAGEVVILYDNGTWKYVEGTRAEPEIKTNPNDFNKPEDAGFLLKSSVNDFGIWLNPKKWKFKKAVMNTDAEYELEMKDGEMYGVIISEKIQIPLLSLKQIAFENAVLVAPDAEIIQQEYRNVNGLKVLFMQINGTTQGIPFAYYSYYYSNESGTIQFVTYTAQNLLGDYRKECDKLLNGLVIAEN